MERKLDEQGRWRNRKVGFRLSEAEAELLNDVVRLSGLPKQDYILKRLMCYDVVVQGNPRVYKALRDKMEVIYEELKRIGEGDNVGEEVLITLQIIAKTMAGLRGDEEDME
jgi:hypothetical protein